MRLSHNHRWYFLFMVHRVWSAWFFFSCVLITFVTIPRIKKVKFSKFSKWWLFIWMADCHCRARAQFMGRNAEWGTIPLTNAFGDRMYGDILQLPGATVHYQIYNAQSKCTKANHLVNTSLWCSHVKNPYSPLALDSHCNCTRSVEPRENISISVAIPFALVYFQRHMLSKHKFNISEMSFHFNK